MKHLALLLRGITATMLLAACASQPPAVDTDSDWQSHRQQLAALENWGFSGKLAVKSANGADSARLRWVQEKQDLQLTLSGPVGMKQLTLQRVGEQLTLTRNGRREDLAQNDRILEAEFGWSLPLDYLPWWLKGLPAPLSAATITQLSAGRLQQLQQDGWTVNYLEYQAVEGYRLPAKIGFSRDQVQGKILLKQWTLNP